MPQPPALMPLSEADYDLIEAAVMETGRGRWFLAEYARRNRHSDTMTLLGAIGRLEAAIRGEPTAQSVDRIRFDLFEMAKAISRTKAEIAAIKPDVEDSGKFGDVTAELDSIVQTTEAATSDILAAAEQVQEIAWTLREQGIDPEVCDLINAKATDIYIACAFQDLTGQRTGKVIQALRYLEGRINAMIDIWGLDGNAAFRARSVAIGIEPGARARRTLHSVSRRPAPADSGAQRRGKDRAVQLIAITPRGGGRVPGPHCLRTAPPRRSCRARRFFPPAAPRARPRR